MFIYQNDPADKYTEQSGLILWDICTKQHRTSDNFPVQYFSIAIFAQNIMKLSGAILLFHQNTTLDDDRNIPVDFFY